MKVLILELNGTKYTTGKITAYLSRQALKIQKEAIELAKKGQEMQNNSQSNGLGQAEELLNALDELRESKTNLICEVYQNRFTVDELEKTLSDEEIDQEINKILYGITGVIAKK